MNQAKPLKLIIFLLTVLIFTSSSFYSNAQEGRDKNFDVVIVKPDQVIGNLPDARLIIDTPAEMSIGKSQQIKCKLAFGYSSPLNPSTPTLPNASPQDVDSFLSREEMNVELNAPGFEVVRILPATQAIPENAHVLSKDFSMEWSWVVRPTRLGKQELSFVAYSNIADPNTHQPMPLAIINKTIEVRSTWLYEFSQVTPVLYLGLMLVVIISILLLLRLQVVQTSVFGKVILTIIRYVANVDLAKKSS